MVDKTVDFEEFLTLVRSGANIRTEQKPTFVAQIDPSAEQLDKMIDKLQAIVDSNIDKINQTVKANEAAVANNKARSSNDKARIDADLVIAEAARENAQVQLKVIETLQQLIKSGITNKPETIDMKPLTTMLTQLQKNTQPKAHGAYKLTFDRDRRTGLIDGERGITATPINSKH